MTDNEKRLVESIVKHDSNVLKLQKEIKENFGLESEYNAEDNVLKLKTSSITESNCPNAVFSCWSEIIRHHLPLAQRMLALLGNSLQICKENCSNTSNFVEFCI